MSKICIIEKLEAGERAGHDGLWAHLKNTENGNVRKDFCHGKYAAKVCKALKEAGIGAKVDCTWKQNPNNPDFWNLNYVKILEKGTPGSTSQSSGGSRGKPGSSKSTATQYRTPDQNIRKDAMRQAIDIGIALIHNPDSGKFFPKTKTTPEMFTDYLFELAEEIVAFTKGERKSEVKSDTADLDEKGVDANEPDLPGDDVPTTDSEDDIPF